MLDVYKVKRILIEKELTQKEVCKRGGLAQCHFSDYLNEKSKPGLNKIRDIARGLDVNVLDIIIDDQTPIARMSIINAIVSAVEKIDNANKMKNKDGEGDDDAIDFLLEKQKIAVLGDVYKSLFGTMQPVIVENVVDRIQSDPNIDKATTDELTEMITGKKEKVA